VSVVGGYRTTVDFALHTSVGSIAGTTERVSVSSLGAEGDDESLYPSISGDGRYVAFWSRAANLVAGDGNGEADVFVHDRQTGTTDRVSVSSLGAEGDYGSYYPSISDDGRYVAFHSSANNLVAGDSRFMDVFVHDRQTGTTERVSVSSLGAEADGSSYAASISADGRCVAFDSLAANLVAGDGNDEQDVFVHDRQTGTTERVSVSSAGDEGHSSSLLKGSLLPSISDDGRYVAFGSYANNLVAGDTNGARDVFVHDRQTGTTERVSVSTFGAEANGYSYAASISADGRYVAFASVADTLVAGDDNRHGDIFVHDRQTGTTGRVSVSSGGAEANHDSYYPSISGDGRYVAFGSYATNLVAGDDNDLIDVFLHDRQTGTTERVSVSSAGAEGHGSSRYPSISGEGRCVAFQSSAANLVLGDSNLVLDVFVRGPGADFSATPTTGTAPLPVNFTDLSTNDPTSWLWTFGDGGTSTAQHPSHQYSNPGDYTVTLVATNAFGSASQTKVNYITVQPAGHTFTVTADCAPDTVPSAGSTSCTATFSDSQGHGIASWSWSDGGAGGAFSPSAAVQNPTYTAPANTTGADILVRLTVTATCGGPSPLSDSDTANLTVQPAGMFSDVPPDHWACAEIEACVTAEIVQGYDDGTYQPAAFVSRDQMAVYISRALAGGESNVPAYTGTPSFTDVPPTWWALKHIEYAVANNVVQGYQDNTYHPQEIVDRAQMAVYVARAMVAPQGDAAFVSYTPVAPRNFPDVPSDSWGYKQIEYCVEHGVVQGYDDNLYHPEREVTRAQMAVYVCRAFDL
jgi:Tol biopolymer transport system component